MVTEIFRGDIVYVNLGQHPRSSVQSGMRPCLVVNSHPYSPVINVCPMSSRLDKGSKWLHVEIGRDDVIGFLNRRSIVLSEQIITVDKKNVVNKVAYLKKESGIMKKVQSVLAKLLSEDSENDPREVAYNGRKASLFR